MLTINEELRKQLQKLNQNLDDTYGSLWNMDRDDLRQRLSQRLGPLVQKEALSSEFLETQGTVVAVDGSNLRIGGNPPHYIEVFQALAKGSRNEDEDIFVSEVMTPLLEEEVENTQQRLARLELEVAYKAAIAWQPWVIMMDGGLIRYQIDAPSSYDVLKEYCESHDIILMGVIKDIKTTLVEEALPAPPNVHLHDREALFGLLEIGEMLCVHDDINHKYKQGLSSAFMRSSQAPTVIGIDVLAKQREHLQVLGQLVLNLTPRHSRGVPLWLDIVDRGVRLTHRQTVGLLKATLSPENFQRFVESERDQRPR